MAKPPVPAHKSTSAAVAAFLDRASALPTLRAAPAPREPARLLFAVDATASRQPTWDAACAVQGEMFGAAVGGTDDLAVSLAYWRGYGEFAATPWLTDPRELARRMAGVSCLGGRTQLLRALDHAIREAARARLGAVVIVGDAVEEAPDPICHAAGRLGAGRVPVFCFQEGGDRAAEATFRQVARLSGGAWAAFDARSPRTLADLLRAAAACARGGRTAVASLPGRAAAGIAGQLPAPSPSPSGSPGRAA